MTTKPFSKLFSKSFSKSYIKAFQDEILQFYYEYGRHHLSIRKTTNPYYIHVSEVMSSQTQIERVEDYFNSWISKFPTAKDVAYTNNTQLLELWQGLGYNSRALHLKEACRQICEEFNNEYPQEEYQLQQLKGVGPYVSCAILCFAFNINCGVVDTNIRRILIHFKFIDEKTSLKDIQIIAKQLCPKNKAREWNNALMDYGALYLTAKKSGIKSLGKQGKFIGSTRYIRSLIIKECLKNSSCPITTISKECEIYNLDVINIISKLEKENVIIIKDDKILLVE